MDLKDIPVEEQIERFQLKISYLKTALHDLFQLVRENEVYWSEVLRQQAEQQSVERRSSFSPKAAPTTNGAATGIVDSRADRNGLSEGGTQ